MVSLLRKTCSYFQRNRRDVLLASMFFFMPTFLMYSQLEPVKIQTPHTTHSVHKVQVTKLSKDNKLAAVNIHKDVALQENIPEPHQNLSSKPKKLYLFAYMRGGSSILGEVFNQDPNGLYWYEPWDSLYSSLYGTEYWYVPFRITHHSNGTKRHIPVEESQELAKRFKTLLECDVPHIPTETLTHPNLMRSKDTIATKKCFSKHAKVKNSRVCKTPMKDVCPADITKQKVDCFHLIKEMDQPDLTIAKYNEIKTKYHIDEETMSPFRAHRKCIHKYKSVAQKCAIDLQKRCAAKTLISGKVLRSTMESMEAVLQEMPDLKVVHYVRDPRGTVLSRAKVNLRWHAAKSLAIEAAYLCKKMVNDIKIRKELEKKYPGVFLEVRYEDLAQFPFETSEAMYSHVGLPLPGKVATWLETNMNAKRTGGHFGTKRANSTATAYAWRSKLKPKVGKQIDQSCKELYDLLGYQPMH